LVPKPSTEPKATSLFPPWTSALFPYQRAGIEFMASRHAALLADDLGLGKTIQLAGLLNYLPEISSCLVVCPPSLKSNWQRELTRYARELARSAKRRVILTGTPLLGRPAELWSLLNILEPERWPNFYQFAHRYCAPVRTSWGWDFSGFIQPRRTGTRAPQRVIASPTLKNMF
jgi:SNF2 family DNA or RNA helicase